MIKGQVSNTALKIALTMVTLDAKAGWHERLPDGLAALSEQMLVAAGAFGYTPRLMRLSRRGSMVRFYEFSESLMPGLFEGMGQRKIFMNAQVLQAIEAGATQVLVIGAGFDTLCLRLAPQFPDVKFVEVDHPTTSAAKSKGVEKVGRPPNMTQIAADLGSTRLSALMDKHTGWDSSARTIVIAEGLLFYLSREDVLALFREIAACSGPDSRCAFSHLQTLRPHGAARAMLRMIGEPWLSAANSSELPQYIGPGWRVLESDPSRAPGDLEGFSMVERISAGTSAAGTAI